MAGKESKDDHGVLKDTDSRIPGAESTVEKVASGGRWGYLTWAIVVVPKVLAGVVLAMCTSTLAVGVTLCCLLLALEFVGKNFSCVKKACLNAKSALQYMTKRIGYAILVLRGDVVLKEKSDGAGFEMVESEAESGVESESSYEEIKVVELKSNGRTVSFEEGNSNKVSLIEYLIVDDKKWKKIDAGDYTDELSVSYKVKKSKSKGKKKSMPEMGAKFIKKIVPKKLRRKSKKHQSGTESEAQSHSQTQVVNFFVDSD